jgi:hypothetical protein
MDSAPGVIVPRPMSNCRTEPSTAFPYNYSFTSVEESNFHGYNNLGDSWRNDLVKKPEHR